MTKQEEAYMIRDIREIKNNLGKIADSLDKMCKQQEILNDAKINTWGSDEDDDEWSEFGINDLDPMEETSTDAMPEETNPSDDSEELITLLNKIYQECRHNDTNFAHIFNVLINRVEVGNELLFQLWCQLNKNKSRYSMNIDYALQSRDAGIHEYKGATYNGVTTDLARLKYNN